MDLKSLSVGQRVGLLVKALNGAKRTNEALARCSDGEAMVEVLLDASNKLDRKSTRLNSSHSSVSRMPSSA